LYANGVYTAMAGAGITVVETRAFAARAKDRMSPVDI